MRRTPMSRASTWSGRRTVRFTGPMPDVIEIVLERASVRGFLACEVCGATITGRRGVDWALHHRRGRTRQPDCHMPQSLLVVHGADNVTACHGRIHRNRAGESYDNGWLIRKGDPRTTLAVPVLLFGEWRHLTADGTYADSPAEVVT